MYEDWLFQNQMRIRIGQVVGFVFAKFHSRRLQRLIRHASDLSNEDPEKSHLLSGNIILYNTEAKCSI